MVYSLLALLLALLALSQISIDEATARLKQREASRHSTTQAGAPTSRPTTRPQAQDRRIAFILDCRGRSFSTLDKAKEQLARAVNRLDQTKSFCVLVVQGDWPIEFQKAPTLESAKADFRSFLEQLISRGGGNASRAVAKAVLQHPDIIWIATVSGFADPRERKDIDSALAIYRGRLNIAG